MVGVWAIDETLTKLNGVIIVFQSSSAGVYNTLFIQRKLLYAIHWYSIPKCTLFHLISGT